MNRLLLLLAAACLPLACAAQLRDENLIVAIPSGFKVGYQNGSARGSIMELVPNGETVERCHEMVTVQVLRGNATGTLPAFHASAVALWIAACEGASTADVAEGTENGYAFQFWLADCPVNKASGTPERAFVKAIAGRDSLYVVQRAYRSGSTNEQTTAASKYLLGVKVCDTRTDEHPCPVVATRPPTPLPAPQ